jgi:dCMP deaminase
MSERISKDRLFLDMARLVARRSTCPRAQVGSVIVRDDHPIGIGYNGSAPGQPHCDEVGCDIEEGRGCVRTLHSESNAIGFAARFGIPTEGCSLYGTLTPCVPCAKLMLSAGIVRFVYADEYRNLDGLELLRENGVELLRENGVELPGTPIPRVTLALPGWVHDKQCGICKSSIVRLGPAGSFVCENDHYLTMGSLR